MKKLLPALSVIFAILMLITACNETKRSSDTTTSPVTTKNPQTTSDKPDKNDPATLSIKVGSYNVKHFADVNHDFSVIAQDILSKDLEVVGLQEIDQNNTRSDGLDEPKLIAQALGWEHYRFAKTINFKGGAYGHCIVSKYPIKSFKVVDLPGGGENRVFGHAVIDVNGTEINFINTHLSHEDKSYRTSQFKTIADYVKKFDNFILVGDFNTSDFTEYSVIENSVTVNNAKFYLTTFPGKNISIDNIVMSDNFESGRPSALINNHSDHYMLYATLKLKLN